MNQKLGNISNFKAPIFILFIFWLFFSSIGRCDSTLVDIFPLETNLRYRYKYERNHWSFPGTISNVSGNVDLIIRNSSVVGDTLRFWQIEERNQISYNIITNDTLIIIQNDTIFFTISESLLANHLITIPNTFIFDPPYFNGLTCISPWSNISVERYSSDSYLIQGIWNYNNFDTLTYFQSVGLASRFKRSSYWGNSAYDDTLTVKQIGEPIVGVLNDNESTLPSKFILHQNYPNPFNPVTTIKYSIPQSDFVNLRIYDMLGREIETLVNEEKPAGEYYVNFDGTNFSSGVYLYKLQTGTYIQAKKLLLLK